MALLAAVRRSACRLASGSALPPSVSVIRATKAVDAAHADACRVWDGLFAGGTPVMDGAASDLALAQYFYGLASNSLGRASAAKATREAIASSLRGATSDIMDASTTVMRASASLHGEASKTLRDGASSYVEGATNLLRASETAGDQAAWYLDAAAGKIGAAANSYEVAVSRILENCAKGSAAVEDQDLLKKIDSELQLAKDPKGKVHVFLEDFPFTIHEKHSDPYFTLTRSYESEEIEVLVFPPSKEECYSQDERKRELSLTVTVMKGGTLTVVRCTALPDQIRTESIYMRLTLGDEEKEEYDISFEDSNSHQSLQLLTARYLELRGVTLLTAEFLHSLFHNRGILEDIFWLGKLKEFVKPRL